ncbi:MAG: OmcA/MtrC family decaheme c-type cytochrome, partial [Candidatus Hydrogenedentota bacterium]
YEFERDVQYPDELRPEVIISIEDEDRNPIALRELTDARFILTRLEDPPTGSTARYVSYTTSIEDPDSIPGSGDEAMQAAYDTARLAGIMWNGDGTYTYKFASALPADFPRDATHKIAGQFRRAYAVDEQSYVYNLIHVFRPDGQDVTAVRELVDTASCNTCHVRLAVHGGARREVQLCIQCHNAQTTDANTGNRVDFAILIHKIHRGAELPSVQQGTPYQVIGFGGGVNDYSTVEFPQDIRNCTVCHVAPEGKAASQADFYKTMPTIEGCVACHDRTWFGDIDATPEGFENHTGGMHLDNRLCSQCHTPDPPGVAPISTAHVLPTESSAAPGLFLDITDITTSEGKQDSAQVTVHFTATDKNGGGIDDVSAFSSLGAVIASPAPEYENAVREVLARAGAEPAVGLVNNGGGNYSYTFTFEPMVTGDTFAVAMVGRRAFEFRGEELEQGTATNGQILFTLDGSEPLTRREIVDEAKCAVCHREIRAHGEQRTGVGLCVMCHNANASDIARRPAEEFPPTSVHFKRLIHSIHMGEELENEFTVFGFGGTPNDFTEVRFPAPRQNCASCHIDGTTDLPLPEEALPSTVLDADNQTVLSQVLATRAACTSCHDSILSNVHALLATDAGGIESCAVCHGADADFAVAEVHRLGP